jgi:hypothetical protein
VRLGEERQQFFFEKKNQKTFVYKVFALPQRLRQVGKSQPQGSLVLVARCLTARTL